MSKTQLDRSLLLAPGKVLQAVTGSTTTTTTTTSETFVTTALSASITPSSSSNKVLVIVHGNLWSANPANSSGAVATIFRGATDLGGGSSIGMAINFDDDSVPFSSDRPCSMVCLDSPSTTSATTYAVYIRTRNASFGAKWQYQAQEANIVLMEIEG